MNKTVLTGYGHRVRVGLLGILWIAASVLQARVLDDFNDNTKTGWQDFTFQAGFGIPAETGGQFRFEQVAAGRPIFSGSQKTSETLQLQEGRTIELRVDIVEGGGNDSFAILGFMPAGSAPSTLTGYGLAKSASDLLVTKGINKYFFDQNISETPAAKNQNITLVLSLTAQGGKVLIHVQVLDKEKNNEVLFDKQFLDTAAADIMASGTDEPAAPFLGDGLFSLFLYQDFSASSPEDPYQVVFDNAEVFITETTSLDDFNDNTKTDWQDFTFVPGFGIPVETGGQFSFEQPPAGRAIFSASQKISRPLELKEGEMLELRADLVTGGEKDSFAVMAFIPTTSSASTLAGYGLAKSTTDILITKGINKYFYNENIGDGPAAKNQNVTLVLSLMAKGGNVVIHAQILDKENNNEVLFDRIFTDTPGADVMADGTDDPAAPFLGTGYFTLYLYQDYDAGVPEDPYRAVFDNALVAAPPAAANLPPTISEVFPADSANFVSATSQITFKVSDDQAVLDDQIAVVLNGKRFTSTNGLVLTGTGNTRSVALGGLTNKMDYQAVITAQDASGASATQTTAFDTFPNDTLMLEIEDFNFDGGQYVNSPVPIPEGSGPQSDSYGNQTGVSEVDYYESRTSPNFEDTMWRNNDPIRMQRSLDNVRAKYTAAGGASANVFDYDVGDITAGEWLNYTRNFPAGTYEVYLRQAVVNMDSGESVLELVTSDRTQPSQTTQLLGTFLGNRTGFKYHNFALTDGTGLKKVVVSLSGVTTLRFRQVTADASDGGRYQNYLAFISVPDPGTQRATITTLSPTPDSTVSTVAPEIAITIENRDTTVVSSSIKLWLNDQLTQPAISSVSSGVTLKYALSPLPVSGATNRARIVFSDNTGTEQSTEWNFVVVYRQLTAEDLVAGTGLEPGFKVRMVQAPSGSGLENSLDRAEEQLKANSSIPKYVETNVVTSVINFNEVLDESQGEFVDDLMVPGLDDFNGTDDYAVEIHTHLELTAGTYRFGVISDDGYKITAGKGASDPGTPPLAYHSGGTANETVDFVVTTTGLYPFRMVWYERGGSGYGEWFSVNLTSQTRALINDPTATPAIKAYTSLATPTIVLQGAPEVAGPYANESAAVIDTQNKTITVTRAGAQRFYRLGAASALRITSVQVVGDQVQLKYQ